jgi:tyrosine type site-specific recombinase
MGFSKLKIPKVQYKDFISVKEATVLFRISKSTIHRMIKQKLIHSVNLGERLTRINKNELEKLFSPIIIRKRQEKRITEKNKREKYCIFPRVKPTKCTVKLRKAEFKEEWHVYIECYPVYGANKEAPKRVRVYLRKNVSTVVFETKTNRKGNTSYKPKRDENRVIICESDLDKETMLFADDMCRKLQRQYDEQYLLNKKINN